MTDEASVPTFTDRIVRLRVFGALLVLGALLAAGLAALYLWIAVGDLGRPISEGEVRMMLVAAASYAGVAVVSLVLGVGSWLAKRWARAIILAGAWVGLVVGSLGMLIFALLMSTLTEAVTQAAADAGGSSSNDVGQAAMAFAMIVSTVVVFVLYVVIPGSFVLAYRGVEVRQTCEWRNPQPSWTDPVSTLSMTLVLILSVCSVSFFLVPLYRSMPFFGTVLRGPALLLLSVALGLVLAWLAVGAARRRMSAWWATLVLLLAGTVSGVVTLLRNGVVELYEDWGLPADQTELARELLESPALHVGWALGLLGSLLYLFWVRKDFKRSVPA